MKPASENHPKPVRWVGSSKEDLSDFPDDYEQWSKSEKPTSP